MIRNLLNRSSSALLLGGLLLGLASGCGGGNTSAAYKPSSNTAREALEAALTAWKKGEKPETLKDAKPPVSPVDSQWLAGDGLVSYEILGEEPGDTEKRFSVKLTTKKGKGEQTVRYVVIGLDPVWVYREEDFERSMNMDNNGPTPQGRAGAKRTR